MPDRPCGRRELRRWLTVLLAIAASWAGGIAALRTFLPPDPDLPPEAFGFPDVPAWVLLLAALQLVGTILFMLAAAIRLLVLTLAMLARAVFPKREP